MVKLRHSRCASSQLGHAAVVSGMLRARGELICGENPSHEPEELPEFGRFRGSLGGTASASSALQMALKLSRRIAKE